MRPHVSSAIEVRLGFVERSRAENSSRPAWVPTAMSSIGPSLNDSANCDLRGISVAPYPSILVALRRTEERMKGRRKKEGIRSLGDGWYQIRVVRVDPRTGKRTERKKKLQAKSMTEAERVRLEMLEAFEKEVDEEAVEGRQRSRLGDAGDAWLARKCEAKRIDGSNRLTENTRERYEDSVEHMLKPFLGAYFVDALTPRLIEEWRDNLGRFYRATTVNGALRVLRTILRDCGSHAADRVAALPEDDTRITADEPNALTEAEAARFLAIAKEKQPKHYPLILLLFTTAARISTALALRWEDIDVKEGVIHFRRRRSGHEVVPGVKRSRTSKDVAPLTDELKAALEAHEAALNDDQKDSGLVFPSEGGGFRSRSVLDEPFRIILKAAGISKRFTPHGCRRTAAALYRKVAGSVVSKAIAGHTTDAMHAHYAVVDAAELRQVGERAGRRLRIIEGSGLSSGPETDGEEGAAS
jgi:integrase